MLEQLGLVTVPSPYVGSHWPEVPRSPRPRDVAGAALWACLVGGRLCAHRFVDHQGRLHVELRSGGRARALDDAERDALELTAQAQPYKVVGAVLGTSFWAARAAVLRALESTGLSTRSHAVWVGTALRETTRSAVSLSSTSSAGRTPAPLVLGDQITIEVTPRECLPLTGAERQVAAGLARGLCNKEIAVERRTSTSTVANQVRTIGEKLAARGRLEIIRALIR